MKFYLKLATFCLSSMLIVGATTANASAAGKSHVISRESSPRVAGNPSTSEQRIQQQRNKLLQVSADYRLATKAVLDQKYSQALPYYERAIAKYPNSIVLYLYRADVYVKIRNKSSILFDDTRSIEKAAMADVQTALKMEPNNPVAYFMRGSVQFASLAFTDGQEDFLKAARLYQLEGDVESYNAAMKATGSISEAKTIIVAPSPTTVAPGVGGGGMGGDLLNQGMNNANGAVRRR